MIFSIIPMPTGIELPTERTFAATVLTCAAFFVDFTVSSEITGGSLIALGGSCGVSGGTSGGSGVPGVSGGTSGGITGGSSSEVLM